ncbi:MAG: hypothetical protein KF760_15770 [Candidatus Eremiobacteraeota bacterium]|nr:hypothetical protein [Candidatus Eremiobacteraeota bacterium]MCW5867422.1 hypothetical protein [Candidatus Eremiobacteraeota bacterium]
MGKWILWLLLALPVWSETYHQAAARLAGQGSSLVLPQSWGGQMASEDLKLLIGALQSVQAWGPTPLSHPVLEDVRLSMHRYRERLQVSLTTLPDSSGALAWLEQVTQLENGLAQLQKSFGGYNLPDAAEVAASDLQRDWNPPGYEDPQDLLRQARSLRIDVLQMSSPFIVPGNGFGVYGLGYGGGWTGDFVRLQQAVYNYENVCNSRYQDVRQTARAFQKVRDAFDEVFPGLRVNSQGMRSVERAIRQLDRFYAAL